MAIAGVIVIGLDPVLVRLGPLAIHWYGLCYALGIGLGLWLALPYARSRGVDPARVSTVAWGTGAAALLGGRLYYVAQTRPSWYLAHPAQILATWQGGMAFYGAVFLGVPALVALGRWQRLPVGVLLDATALCAAAGQAVGRVGNIINGDVVGYPSTLPWATLYTNSHAFAPTGVAYEPAAAYELLFDLAMLGVLWRLRRRPWPAGALFLLYLVLYAAGQFLLFYRRSNPLVALDLKQAQLTSLAVLAVALPLLILRLRTTAARSDRPQEASRAVHTF